MNDRLNGAVKQGIEEQKSETLSGAIARHASTLQQQLDAPKLEIARGSIPRNG